MGLFDFFRFRKPAAAAPKKDDVADRIVNADPASGYRPQTPISFFTGQGNQLPPLHLFYQELEAMRVHPDVSIALNYYKSGIVGAEFDIRAKSPAIEEYVREQLRRLWAASLAKVQEAYDWGWCGGQIMYRRNDDGRLAFDCVRTYHARDVLVLRRGSQYMGVRVNNAADSGPVDLWGPSVGLAKGFWYAHNAQHGEFFGRSQLLGAWRPWRRLAWQDGGEDVIDIAVYRFGVRGVICGYPPDSPTFDPSKRDPRNPTNQEKARFIAESFKAGASLSMPTTQYQNGTPQWTLQVPGGSEQLNVDSLINYTGSLEKKISMGIGVPPELLQASETGSGYSGREIPLEAFYENQMTVARAIVNAAVEQIVRPLVVWNWGPEYCEFDVEVLPLLASRAKRLGKAQQPGAQDDGRVRGPDGKFLPAGGSPGLLLAGRWKESDHPRGDNGRWITKDEISSAKRDPRKADALRARVSDPKQRALLEHRLQRGLFDDEPADDGAASPAEAKSEYQLWLETPDGQAASERFIESARRPGHELRANKLDPANVFKRSQADGVDFRKPAADGRKPVASGPTDEDEEAADGAIFPKAGRLAYQAAREAGADHAAAMEAGYAASMKRNDVKQVGHATIHGVKPGDVFEVMDNRGQGKHQVKFFPGREDGEIGVGQADDKTPRTYMPEESASHFVHDLNGVVKVPGRSGNKLVDAVASGDGEYLGKGNDGLAFAVGDKVVKVSTTVPYHPFNPGNRSPGDAAAHLANEAEMTGLLLDNNVPGILPAEFIRHGDKGFLIRDRVKPAESLTAEQLRKVRRSMDAMHAAGFVLGDEVQVGLKDGEPFIYDLGAVRRSTRPADLESDSSKFERFAEKMGHDALPLAAHGRAMLADLESSRGFMPDDELNEMADKYGRGVSESEAAAGGAEAEADDDGARPAPKYAPASDSPADVDAAVLRYMRENDGAANVYDVRSATGVASHGYGDDGHPLDKPLNASLKRLHDSGHLEAVDGRGNRFRLTEKGKAAEGSGAAADPSGDKLTAAERLGMRRASKGGEYGLNQEWYEGGRFLPDSENPAAKRYRQLKKPLPPVDDVKKYDGLRIVKNASGGWEVEARKAGERDYQAIPGLGGFRDLEMAQIHAERINAHRAGAFPELAEKPLGVNVVQSRTASRHADAMADARLADQNFQGGGRYEAEVWEKLRRKYPDDVLPPLSRAAAEWLADEFDRDGKPIPAEILADHPGLGGSTADKPADGGEMVDAPAGGSTSADGDKPFDVGAHGSAYVRASEMMKEHGKGFRGVAYRNDVVSAAALNWGVSPAEARRRLDQHAAGETVTESEPADVTDIDAEPEPSPEADPREAAAAAADVAEANDYEFARASSVPNAGEDLKGSARHKRNEWRGLAEAEKDGTAAAMVTRENLLKAEPPELTATLNKGNAIQHLIAHLAINKFPASPTAAKGSDRYNSDGKAPTNEEGLRAQYYEAYRTVRDQAQKLAAAGTDPQEMFRSLQGTVSDLIHKFRGAKSKEYMHQVSAPDRYNPVANSLVSLHKSLSTYRAGVNSVAGRMREFMAKTKAIYGDDTAGHSDEIMGHISDILAGDSFNTTFGTKKDTGGRMSSADFYVKHAERKGGRVIDAETVKAGTTFVTRSLGMRGLQWGNSVTDDERQHHLKQTSEAFADLADMTGLPDSAMSLGGVLGLAIGARGKGTARAHYEPETRVINLTRKSGVGSLCHEWAHALDNYLGGGSAFLSSASRGGRGGSDEIAAAMRDVVQSMNSSGFASRIEQWAAGQGGKMEYWTSTLEMFARVFEKHIQAKLRAEGRENTYLTGAKTADPWPTPDELAGMSGPIEKLLAAIKASGKFDGKTMLAGRPFGGVRVKFEESKHPRDDHGRWTEANMTLGEYDTHLQRTGLRGNYGPGPQGVRLAHRTHVEDSLMAGAGVPPEVLAEYPDLAKRYSHVKPATHRVQVARSKRMRRDQIIAEAEEDGATSSDLHGAAAEIRQLDAEAVDVHNRIIERAKTLLDKYTDVHRKMNQRAKRGGANQIEDVTHIPGIDEVSRQMAGEFPGHFGNNYGYDSGSDYQADDSDEILFGYLTEGKRKPLTDEEVYEKAAARVAETLREKRLAGGEQPEADDDGPRPNWDQNKPLEPHEMTLAEYSRARGRHLLNRHLTYYKNGFIGLPEPDKESSRANRIKLAAEAGIDGNNPRYVEAVTSWGLHKLHVAAALGRGESVPNRVLRAYPDLAPAGVMLSTVPAPSPVSPGLAGVIKELARDRVRLVSDLVKVFTKTEPLGWLSSTSDLVDEYLDSFAQAVAFSRLSASLAAIRRVASSLPARLPADVGTASLAGLLPDVWVTPETIAGDPEARPIANLVGLQNAVSDLAARNILTRPEFDRLAAEARAEAFTVAGIVERGVIGTIRDLTAEAVDLGENQAEWRAKVFEELNGSPFLSPAHAETVFRANVYSAYSRGLEQVLADPMVADLFPYAAIDPIRDNRCRPWHAALATAGIDGTNVFYRDDPTFLMCRPPSDYGCRCGWRPLTVAQAAAAGVAEAQKWLDTGVPPVDRTWCLPPANWQQSPGWVSAV